jgi:hypothetical protein
LQYNVQSKIVSGSDLGSLLTILSLLGIHDD